MQEIILCDECKKEKCPQKLKGAVCTVDKKMGGLSAILETRDPILFARKFTDIIDSERERYFKGKKVEGLGEEEEIDYVTKTGEVRTKKVIKGIDNRVSDLAFNILKGAKVISDIANPKSDVQQTTIGNQNILIVNEINSLPESHRNMLIKKFIDDKLDASEKDRAIPGECVPGTA